ncbi:helix-turn-helix transcriptional regulator [Rhodospirillaceae bacterium KN72]|uniref:Helix-turn-helix transcriptional regulator n=1 Tax=Pacificispira spongiicola TaxID=2729598 RepID=A0A7Y0E0Q3_9PROT|nr:helix-turn-helix domain-containing protein [Pacificispira spongiicola]NMM45071.1 helix-turn-helix transcriptional regulator [Pacificispira spongiicola]
MTGSIKKHASQCLVAHGLDIFGDRWTLLVLRDMILYGKRRYGEFLEAEEAIATNVLADRLKRLAAEGLVTVSKDPDNRRSNIYTLTDKGLSLMPVIFEIMKWSAQYCDLNERRRKLIARLTAEPDTVMAEIRAREAANENPAETAARLHLLPR